MSMLVRKFEADDMASALKQVKETLGAEALILSTKTHRKKGLGVLGKQTIEVTAAIESPAMKASAAKKIQPAAKQAAPQKIPAAYRNRIDTLADELVDLSQATPTPAAASSSPQVAPANHALEDEVRSLRSQLEAQDVSHLQSEIDQLKGLVQQLAQNPRPQEPVPAPESKVAAPQTFSSEPVAELPVVRRQAAVSQLSKAVPSDLADLIDLLVEQGIDSEAAATIAHLTNDVIAIYPITPASPMGEWADEWSSLGVRNLWGTVPEVVEMQSEAGAAGARRLLTAAGHVMVMPVMDI